MNRSRTILKVDAAERVFPDDLEKVTWAVIDSGINPAHPAFRDHTVPGGTESRVRLRIDVPKGLNAMHGEFSVYTPLVGDETWTRFLQHANVTTAAWQPRPADPSRDDHATHIAGIIGADAIGVDQADPADPSRRLPDRMRGMHPTVDFIDINVFDENAQADEFSVIVALDLVRWLNDGDRGQHDFGLRGRICGVNLSLSVPYDASAQACGWTPLCQAVDRLSSSGVVTVACAGNNGYDTRLVKAAGLGFRMMSITDPGNAECAITVGATDSTAPYRFGPIALSSRGPTADGRHKPDVLAPGSRIVGPAADGGWIEDRGTSQAAAHVSGVASRLLARFPELIGRPDRVKQLLMVSASDLGRLPDFQGAGLVDALRTMQAP